LADVLATPWGIQYFADLGYTVETNGQTATFLWHNMPFQMFQDYDYKFVLAADIQIATGMTDDEINALFATMVATPGPTFYGITSALDVDVLTGYLSTLPYTFKGMHWLICFYLYTIPEVCRIDWLYCCQIHFHENALVVLLL
jgi:hypothetical protein